MKNDMLKLKKQKKLLILAGASVHVKLVKAAKKLGVYTIVTDYLQDSPAKQIADESWMLNITDIDEIVSKCKENHVDGVITGWIDPCQRPYQEICQKLGFPCLGTSEQFINMTDKHKFKKMCKENHVQVIPEYTLEDVKNKIVEFPVFVKPVDSRGSRGQAVCRNYNELKDAIEDAIKESSNGDILIEKFMEDCHEFQVTYFFANGTPYLIRTVDSYTGTLEEKLNKVVICSVSPSVYTETYLEKTNDLVISMFKNLGIKNGPIFMQGFEKSGEFYFFDPGLRFPGVDYDLVYKKIYGIDLMEAMVIYALTGKIPEMNIPDDIVFLNGRSAAILFPIIGQGTISSISGYSELNANDEIISILPRAFEGDKIEWTYNVNQRLSEIDFISNSRNELIDLIKYIQDKLKVLDENKKNMLYGEFDTTRIK